MKLEIRQSHLVQLRYVHRHSIDLHEESPLVPKVKMNADEIIISIATLSKTR